MKKFFLLFVAKKVVFFAFMFLPFFASAAAYAPVKVSNAVSGVIEQKLVNRGFAANDPRYAATIQTSGTVISAAAGAGAAAIVVGAITAPAWVTAAVAAGVAVAVGYAVSLAIDGVTEWLFGSDSSTVNVVTAEGGSSLPGALVAGGPYWSTSYSYASTPEGAVAGSWADGVSVSKIQCTMPGSMLDYSQAKCTSTGTASWLPPNFEVETNPVWHTSGSPYSSTTGVYKVGVGQFPAPDTGTGTGGKTGNMSMQAAIDQLSDGEKAKALNPALVAGIANQAWEKAAQAPGYQGLPYSYNDPITAADAAAWQSANPGSWPSVGDFVTPFPNGSTGTSPSNPPFTLPKPGEAVNPVNPGTGSQVNLGTDPGIGAPTLEPTPTGAQILAPITGLMPDLKNFQVPSHQGECPKPEFDIAVLHTHVRMDAQCTLFEGVRGQLYNGSLVGWIIAALFIVLSA